MIWDVGETAKINLGGERWAYLTSILMPDNVAIILSIFNKTGIKMSVDKGKTSCIKAGIDCTKLAL